MLATNARLSYVGSVTGVALFVDSRCAKTKVCIARSTETNTTRGSVLRQGANLGNVVGWVDLQKVS